MRRGGRFDDMPLTIKCQDKIGKGATHINIDGVHHIG